MFKKDKRRFSELEEDVLRFWEASKVFEKSLEHREKCPRFTYYDGPPFATGLPHYGHIVASTLKDVVARYKSMQGYYVRRRFAWDCHGLPIENEIENEFNLKGAHDIEKFGIARFNTECRNIVLRYTAEWKKTLTRVGRWVEFDRTCRTMDIDYMETVWWVFSELWKKDLVYKGFKVMPYSCKLGTPLSNFEANLNYQEVSDPSLTVKFAVQGAKDTYFLAWTTTPWTLPSNLGLAVKEDFEYVKVLDKQHKETYYLAKGALGRLYKSPDEYTIVEQMEGKALVGLAYEPLFPYFAETPNAFKILSADFISDEDGTGIVHMAPAFGEDDYAVCQEAKIAPVCPIDVNGHFTQEVSDFAGLFVKEADKPIIAHLKREQKVFKHETMHHRYPFCWRTDTPLIYRIVSTWFVSVETIKDRLIANNQKIHWVPDHIKNGRFGKWLENARDWAISRNRYWGTPIPIWMAEDGDIQVIGSIAELEEKSGQKISDLHRDTLDTVTFTENGKVYQPIKEVFDCWFESGSIPYAHNHYPFENVELTEKELPADFIAEGLDQTRGWFYTLNVLATALFDKPAYHNVIVNGIILAEDGQKMSKRLKNYPEPEAVMDRHGADGVRLYLLQSPVVKAQDFRFSEQGVEQVVRQFLLPMWNSYLFLATYAEIYDWRPEKEAFTKAPAAQIDRWILSVMQTLVVDVEKSMDLYTLDGAIAPFLQFIDQLTNWYIRRNRSRFWADEDSPDRQEAFMTLYVVLKTLVKLSAPYIPFLTETIYQQLRLDQDPISVHHCDFPAYDGALYDQALEEEMEYTQVAVNAGHSLRKEHKVKTRQPLLKAHIAATEPKILASLQRQKALIMDELNVKEIVFHEDVSEFVTLTIKPNYRVLGKKVGPLIKQVAKHLENLSPAEEQAFVKGESWSGSIGGEALTLDPEDVVIQYDVKPGVVAQNVGPITLALDLQITEDLEQEGIARELINKINTMRKQQDFAVTDRIAVQMETTPKVRTSVQKFSDYIQGEILAKDIQFTSITGGTSWDINGENTLVHIQKSTE